MHSPETIESTNRREVERYEAHVKAVAARTPVQQPSAALLTQFSRLSALPPSGWTWRLEYDGQVDYPFTYELYFMNYSQFMGGSCNGIEEAIQSAMDDWDAGHEEIERNAEAAAKEAGCKV
jgi:hypothetical protein